MTGLELERIARAAIPPVGATAVVAVVDHEPGELLKNGAWSGKGGRTRHGAAWLIDGRIRSAPIALFDRPRDAIALVDLLNGEASRPAPEPDLARPFGADRRDAVPASTEAPVLGAGASPRCAGCGDQVPPGRHGQRRLTCSDRCRRRVARRAADEATRADTDGVAALVTPSRPPIADPSSRDGADTLRRHREATDPTDLSDGQSGVPLSLGL